MQRKQQDKQQEEQQKKQQDNQQGEVLPLSEFPVEVVDVVVTVVKVCADLCKANHPTTNVDIIWRIMKDNFNDIFGALFGEDDAKMKEVQILLVANKSLP